MAGEIGCCGQVIRVVFIILNGALMVSINVEIDTNT